MCANERAGANRASVATCRRPSQPGELHLGPGCYVSAALCALCMPKRYVAGSAVCQQPPSVFPSRSVILDWLMLPLLDQLPLHDFLLLVILLPPRRRQVSP